MGLIDSLNFFQDKRVFVTGHTGFKGSWLCVILNLLGADVYGYALPPNTSPALFELAYIAKDIHSSFGDIRDLDSLKMEFCKARPHVVLHLAAQPLVFEGYNNPRSTYEVNIMGTINVLECLRQEHSVRSFVNITTDKVYQNIDSTENKPAPFIETDTLDGWDPYANSKSCSELATWTYCRSSLLGKGNAVSTARAGNVIGGGDFASNRLVPDCVRAAMAKTPISVRHPQAVRPFQHVLEPLFAYLLLAAKQETDPSISGAYNIGPDISDCLEVSDMATVFCELWGNGQTWHYTPVDGPHESSLLMLDNSKARDTLGWQPTWNAREALSKTVEWTKTWLQGDDVLSCMQGQIDDYLGYNRT